MRPRGTHGGACANARTPQGAEDGRATGRNTKPVDLARERRLRALDEQARALLTGRPDLQARFGAYLEGTGPTMAPKKSTKAKTGTNEVMLTFRVPPELVARVDALVTRLADDLDVAVTMGRLTRSGVMRLALMEGVKYLEARHWKPPRRTKGRAT